MEKQGVGEKGARRGGGRGCDGGLAGGRESYSEAWTERRNGAGEEVMGWGQVCQARGAACTREGVVRCR